MRGTHTIWVCWRRIKKNVQPEVRWGNNSSVPVFQLIRTTCLCCFLLALSCVFEEGTFFEVTRMREAAGLAKKEKRLLAFLVGLRCARKLWCDRGAFKILYYIFFFFFFPCTTENIKLLPHLMCFVCVVTFCCKPMLAVACSVSGEASGKRNW